MFRLRLLRNRIGSPVKNFTRSYSQHKVPVLSQDFHDGVPGFLGPAAFDLAWTGYQSLMLEKLNMMTAGGPLGYQDTKQLALTYARDPNAAPLFNHASMAHNNHFFFKCLSETETLIPNALKKELEASFSSIENLQEEIIMTATSMFGPGFVWLVMDRSRKFSILATYIAGSPYAGAHYRQQRVDMNTEMEEPKYLSEHHRALLTNPPVNTVGQHGQHSVRPTKLAPGGVELTPVLCINMWEHVWLPDYGLGNNGQGGKLAYAQNWWKRIDWNVVSANASSIPQPQGGGGKFLK